MSHPEEAEPSDAIKRYSQITSRGEKQHVRTLWAKNKDKLPEHIKDMFDNTENIDKGKRAHNNELIENLFVKRNGKWEMNLSAPIFEQAKTRCYIYRRWNLNP